MLSAKRDEFDTYYITETQAKNAVCISLKLPFLPQSTVIELFEGDDSFIIFADVPPSFYVFESFEDVISACKSCTAENSSLYCYDEAYILSVSLPCPILEEFSHSADAGPYFDLFLKEHGKVLISNDAVNFVKNTF